MAAAALKVSPVSGDFLIQLAIAAVGLYAGYWLYTKARAGLASSFENIAAVPGELWSRVREVGAGAVEAVANTAAELAAPVVQSATAMRAAAPGATLPAGWFTVKTWQGNIVTQHPDAFKSLNRWDSVLVDP